MQRTRSFNPFPLSAGSRDGAASAPAQETKVKETTATSTAAPRFHKVQKGDTLSSIARKYDLEPKDLKVWNKLKGDRVVLGQKLRLVQP